MGVLVDGRTNGETEEENEIMNNQDGNESSSSNDNDRVHVNKFTFLLTNARSLAPKIDSLIENFSERDVDLCVVTETWLNDESGLLEDEGVDLSLGEGISTFHCGRPVGRRGGGVGIYTRNSRIKAVDITPKDNVHELCAVLCSLRGTSRKIICIGAYLTTALDVAQAEVFLECVNDMVHAFKGRYSDPYIIVAGDLEQGQHQHCL